MIHIAYCPICFFLLYLAPSRRFDSKQRFGFLQSVVF